MKDNILLHTENDSDTLVLDINDGRDADHDQKDPLRGSASGDLYDPAGDLTESDKADIMGGSKALYVIAWAIALLSGTAAGVIGAITAAAGRLTDITEWAEEDVHWIDDYTWYGIIEGEHTQADYVSRGFLWLALACAVFIASVVVLCILSGRFSRGHDNRIKLNWFDRIWTEIQLVLAICAASGAVSLAYPVWILAPLMNWYSFFEQNSPNDYYYEVNNWLVIRLCVVAMAACIAIAVANLVSMVKKLKAGEFISRSLLGKIFRWLGIGAAAAGHGAARAGKGLRGAMRDLRRELTVPGDADRSAAAKLIARYILIAAALIMLPLLVGAFSYSIELMFVFMIISIVLASILIIRKVGKLAEIRAGVIAVKSGNLSHKITVNVDDKGPKTDLDKLASDINHISEATNVAVQNEIKNQRLKTDLISNVSHDLKTPLTSMISYLDILTKEGLDSPDAPAHLAIVQEKTERLKTLTEDLFEAAKASSGNIPCEIGDIDIASLIDQSLAEMEDRLNKRKLRIRKNIRAENTMVRADGKLLYRVFENLLGNISKYALDKSRVYIDVTDVSEASGNSSASEGKATGRGRTLIEFKNISRDELNISADELMERFTRGDQSRNTEGSGLGLAIAKDLTNLMGGVFELSIDGDMFKASIILDNA